MATSKEFNRLFDKIAKETKKIEDAKRLAFSLGYDANYCDGIMMEDYNFRKKEINALVGKNWPQEVKDAYDEGANQGYWES